MYMHVHVCVNVCVCVCVCVCMCVCVVCVRVVWCQLGPEPALLDWYGYCGLNKLYRGVWDMLPKEHFRN